MKESARYKPIYQEIKKLYDTDQSQIIAIDGRCGSGKTTLANNFMREFDVNVFHMDDFFLPIEMRSNKRLLEPGGNVHYERFKKEVLIPLVQEKEVVHRRYNPQKNSFEEPITTHFKKLTIVEGSYCLHPSFEKYYDLKIFLTVHKQEQLERIRKRNGEKKLQDFKERWIPMEEHYFKEFNIADKCHLIIETTKGFD